MKVFFALCVLSLVFVGNCGLAGAGEDVSPHGPLNSDCETSAATGEGCSKVDGSKTEEQRRSRSVTTPLNDISQGAIRNEDAATKWQGLNLGPKAWEVLMQTSLNHN